MKGRVMGIYAVLQQSRAAYGSKPALFFRRRYRTVRWTYRDLGEYVQNIAAALAARDIGPADKVLLLGNNSPYWVAAFFAVLARGAVVVPLNPRSTPEQLERIAAAAEPKLLLLARQALWTGPAIVSLNIEEAAATAAAAADMPGLHAAPEDLAEIVYTSGTTGAPKGVMLTHGNLLAVLRALPDAIPLRVGDNVMSIVPLFHVYGQVAGMLYPLQEGCIVTYFPSLSSREILNTLAHVPADYLVTVPEFLKTFMERLDSKLSLWPMWLRHSLRRYIRRNISPTLHTLVSGGAPLDPEVEGKWRALGFDVLQGYGLTETSPMIAMNTAREQRLGSVGKPMDGVHVKIAADGEILVKGPNVMQGYYRDEQRTRESFRDGWLKTDDGGRFDADGFLYVFGRKKYMILGPGGENVFPEDLESELNRCPGVHDSAVIGLQRQGRTVIHALLLSDNRDGDAIVEQANRHLAPHQQIMDWSLWPGADFPRSATRKVKKEELIRYLQNRQAPPPASRAQVTRLTRLIAQTTNSDPHAVDDRTRLVADLGVDSLLRIELIGRIEEEFGCELAENSITAQTTVKELQILIDAHQGAEPATQRYPRWSMRRFCVALRPLLQNVVFRCLPLLGTVRIEGLENLQGLQQPVIFMPNHRSYLDGLYAVRAIPDRFRRRLGIAAAIDPLYEHFWWFAPCADLLMNSYPFGARLTENIKPGLEFTGRLLDDGWNVLIFPEGAMNRSDAPMLPLKGGAGVLAVEMQVPIVPMALIGTAQILPPEKLLPRRRGEVVIRFGAPLTLAAFDNYNTATQRVEKAMRDLLL
ncbi:MAG: AMP-binding protein [Gammaproteobacteria bacterium]